MITRVLPHNLDTERTIIGSMIVDKNALFEALEALKPDHFYSSAHQVIFKTIQGLAKKEIGVDLITLNNALEADKTIETVGGVAYLSEIVETSPTAPLLASYAQIIMGLYTARETIKTCTNTIEACFGGDDIHGVIEKHNNNLMTATGYAEKSKISYMGELLGGVFEEIERKSQNQGITGVTTGIRALDSTLLGLQPGDLIIIAGRPSMGKSALALTIANNAWTIQQIPTLIFSLEMVKNQIVQRAISINGQVELKKLRSGKLSPAELQKTSQAAAEIYKFMIGIDDSFQLTVWDIRNKVRREIIKNGIKMIIVDYLQLMGGDSENNRNRELGQITRQLKGIAKEYNIPVIALSQLSRVSEQQNAKPRKPRLSDLRESGAIEQDADVVLFVHREYMYSGNDEDKDKAEIIVGKQRQGETTTVNVRYVSQYTLFTDLTEDQADSWQDRF